MIVQGLLELQKNEINNGLQDYILLKVKMEVLLRKTTKYKKFLAIKDPLKQIYGPKMLEKMRNICERFENIDEVFEEQLIPIFESIELEYKRKLFEMDQEEKRRKEEEFQKRVQQGIQETYLEEKRRLDILKKKQEEEARKKYELDRLNAQEQRKKEEMNLIINNIVELINFNENNIKDKHINLDLALKFVYDGIIQMLNENINLKDFYSTLNLISDLLGTVIR